MTRILISSKQFCFLVPRINGRHQDQVLEIVGETTLLHILLCEKKLHKILPDMNIPSSQPCSDRHSFLFFDAQFHIISIYPMETYNMQSYVPEFYHLSWILDKYEFLFILCNSPLSRHTAFCLSAHQWMSNLGWYHFLNIFKYLNRLFNQTVCHFLLHLA